MDSAPGYLEQAPPPVQAMPVLHPIGGPDASPPGSVTNPYGAGQSLPQGGGSSGSRRQSDKSLFISGLHPDCEFTHLHERFQAYGKVISCRVLRDARSGLSRCIGYVNFALAGDAANAIASQNGQPGPCGGGPLTIRYAEDDPAFIPEETRKLFIRYVPLDCTTERIREAFSVFGLVTECTVMPDMSSAARGDPEPWNMAYVTYNTAEEATNACARTNRSFLLGPRHQLSVKPAETLATRTQRQRKRDSGSSTFASSAGSHMSASGSATQGMYGAPPMMQANTGAAPVGMQIAVPPGYQLAYLPGAGGALTPVLIPLHTQAAQPAAFAPPPPPHYQQPQPQYMQYGEMPQQQTAQQMFPQYLPQ
jgi:hypothetical protein